MIMCRIIPMAWFWPFITPFMKIFACGGLTISFKALFLMKKLLSKITSAAGEKKLGSWGGTPLWFEKFTPPPQERKPHPLWEFWPCPPVVLRQNNILLSSSNIIPAACLKGNWPSLVFPGSLLAWETWAQHCSDLAMRVSGHRCLGLR